MDPWSEGSHIYPARKAVYVAGALIFALAVVGFIRECGRSKIAVVPSASPPDPVGSAKPTLSQLPPIAIQPTMRESLAGSPSVTETEGVEGATAHEERSGLGPVTSAAGETGDTEGVRAEAQALSVEPTSSTVRVARPSFVRIYFRAREFPTHTMVRLDGKAVRGLDSRRLVNNLVVQSEVLSPGEYELEIWLNPARLEDGPSAHAALRLTLKEGQIAVLQASFSADAQRLVLTSIP